MKILDQINGKSVKETSGQQHQMKTWDQINGGKCQRDKRMTTPNENLRPN